MIALLMTLGATASPTHEALPETAEHATAEAEHHHVANNVVGVKVFGLTAVEQANLPHMADNMVYGAGLFYERAFVHGMLDVEFAALMCRGGGSTVAPLELLLKKPFHPTDALTLYMGVGPTLDFVFTDAERKAVPALMAVGGGYLWVNSHIGMDLEVSAGHLFEHHGMHEYVFATGPVVHF